ncbi:MAG: iron ABC transporter permease [Bacillota bacterium]|nr:iron ABC transporter permease [Bacillota bacterium]
MASGKPLKKSILLAALFAAGIIIMIVSLGVGSSGLGLSDFFRLLFTGGDSPEKAILFNIRFPRVILSYLVGAGLSVSGAVLQGLFKNPMADPHVLGVSSGAGLGAAAFIVFGGAGIAASGGLIALCAFSGGIIGVYAVYLISGAGRRSSSIVALLLSGIAVSSLLTALISLLMVANRAKMDKIILWTMGSFTSAGWGNVIWAAGPIVLGCIGCIFFSRDLNIMLLGEEEARQLGVDLKNTRRILLLLTTLITGCAVAFCGIIGFVGLIVPHMVRMAAGPDHKWLLPASFLGGGAFLTLVDTLARTVASPLEIPIGILTALCGVPFFLYLLTKHRRRGRAV